MTALLLTVLGCSSLVLLPRVQWGGKRGAAQHRCSSFMVSERHNQAYKESIKLYAALEPSSPMPATLELVAHTPIETMYHQGHLVHETVRPLLRPDECQAVVDESEEWADRAGSTVLDYYCALLPSLSSTSSPTRTLLPRKVTHLPPPPPMCHTPFWSHASHAPPPRRTRRAGGWTSKRHFNHPTTDIPLQELPRTLKWFNQLCLDRIYPMLGQAFDGMLPNPRALRVADAFVVKYNATGGQTFLSPHRDGSVITLQLPSNYPPITLQLPSNCPPIKPPN